MKNILIIEDEPGIIRLLSHLIELYLCERGGVKIETAKTTNDAERMIRQCKLDAIFIDGNLSGGRLDGPETTHLIVLAQLHQPTAKLIACSGDQETMDLFEIVGCHHDLMKPIRLEKLGGILVSI